MPLSNRKHRITAITPDSIADQMEITAGDFLLEVDGAAVGDVFDYRMATAAEELTLLIEKPDGELWELEIEKDEDEDLGMEFESALMDDVRTCRNKCIFCFVDQQPHGLRDSLYVKDDDVRLSFLHGNYVTLTNLDDEEIARIARYHLSPLRISVHTTDADLRVKMTGNRHAGKLNAALQTFNNAGIDMHFQAVICKSYNDGTRLDKTIEDLLAYQPGAQSLAIVPAGTTRHREGLPTLAPFTAEDAAQIIAQVEAWQKKCLAQMGTRFVFAADEWYVLAGQHPPNPTQNEDYPQLENGVGLFASFGHEFAQACGKIKKTTCTPLTIGIVTGTAAADFMRSLAAQFMARFEGCNIHVFPIHNDFFGHSVTVSGLLTGRDIIAQLITQRNQLKLPDVIFLPGNAFRAGTEDMLDGLTRAEVEAALGVPVIIGNTDGEQLARALQEVICCNSHYPNS